MRYTSSAVIAVALLTALSVPAYGLGKKAKSMEAAAKSLREEANKQRAEAAALEKQSNELNDIANGKNVSKAEGKLQEVRDRNVIEAAKGIGQDLIGNKGAAARTAAKGEAKLGDAWADVALEAATSLENPEVRAGANQAREKASEAKAKAEALEKMAAAADKRAKEQRAADKKAAEKKAASQHERDGGNGGIGRGDAREVPGNDRAMEKAGRTG
jgi:colicin import membrane protein